MAHFAGTVTLGKDPELKTSQDGRTTFAKFGGAWSESSKDRQGSWVQGPTVWLLVTVFGRQAQNLVQSAHKGDRVAVVGRLKPEAWQSDHGEQTVLALVADSVTPDLTFASAQVVKNPKQGGGGYGGGQQQGGGDPWNSAPASNGFDDGTPPPF
ncbi:single-stranded DNA-binding protein [Corynebacterium sp.]|uniref:single-stranded DNA-binding protein n=1 Tax=Corynebacterium sp. TaxID=1720 RepID=UPI0025BA16F3|nr:single-stranded DNA-binding protein [Corynebacterium sp.]